MKYAALVYGNPSSLNGLSDEDRQTVTSEYMAVAQDPRCVDAAQLQPVTTATTVRVQDGRTLTTDGPFADTKEVFGGYYIFDAANLDEAIELASRLPATWMGGSVEVRPVVENQPA